MTYNPVFPISSKSYTLENKGYSRKLLGAAVAVSVDAGEVKGTVSPVVMIRRKTLMGSMAESAETIPIRGFLLMPQYG